MPDEKSLEAWRPIIQPFLESKLNEFHLLGLNHLQKEEFWQFVKESLKKKKENGPERLHEVVAAVMALSVNDYMDKLRVDLFKDSPDQLGRLFGKS